MMAWLTILRKWRASFSKRGGERAAVLEEADGALDNVAPAVADEVVADGAAGPTAGRDDGADAVVAEPLADAAGVVGLITTDPTGPATGAPHPARHAHAGHERLELGRLMRLAGEQQRAQRDAHPIAEEVELGAISAPGSAEGVVGRPPFFAPRRRRGWPGSACCRPATAPSPAASSSVRSTTSITANRPSRHQRR